MDKENQIKGIAEVLRHLCENECFRTEDGFIDCDACEACYLYEAGYRRQIEGRWEEFEGECFICSECAKVFGLGSTATIHDVKRVWKYCPNCGAQMRGDEKNG